MVDLTSAFFGVGGLLALVGIVTFGIRRIRGCKVNCWFCNSDQRVAWSSRNRFICSTCGQYNGFAADGGYDRTIHEQHFLPSRAHQKRFCTPAALNGRPDVLPSENGLCDDCNQKQAIIIERLQQFEPRTEDNWQAEVDDYKNRLNKIYALCEACIMSTQKKFARDRNLYGYLMQLKSFAAKLLPTRYDGTGLSPMVKLKRRRKYFFGGGRVTELTHALIFLIAALLAFAEFNFLQQRTNADSTTLDSILSYLINGGVSTSWLLGLVHDYFYLLVMVVFFLQFTAILTNQCRISFPDLLVMTLSCVLFAGSFDFFPSSFAEDLVLLKCGFSSLLFCLASAVWLIPRKMKHKRRPNAISSAFSVASTPLSQCSTIRSVKDLSAHSYFNGNNSSVLSTSRKTNNKSLIDSLPHEEEKYARSMSMNSSSSLTKWRDTRAISPASTNTSPWMRANICSPTLSEVSFSQSSRSTAKGRCNPNDRENTPSRDLGGLLSGLHLGKGERGAQQRRGPFGSLSFHPGVQQQHFATSQPARTKSHFTGFTSISRRPPNPWGRPLSAKSLHFSSSDDSVSVSTKITDAPSNPVGGHDENKQKLLIILVALCFLTNLSLLYYLISRG